MSILYNPFSREFSEIETKDLAILREVSEGWYVEYKREKKPQKDIAKSLAAFANHYGGWIFYGVEQAKDGSNKADSFLGVAKEDEVLLIEHLRNAAKDNINPSPFYEYRIFVGPCKEIELPTGRSVIAVMVPSGSDTPYIHSDGKIYRRIADSSDPKPETDRFILDHLWQRREQAYTKVKEFIEQTNIPSEEEDETSYLDLFLIQNPLGNSRQSTDIGLDKFKEVLTKPFGEGIFSPYNSFYTIPEGFIARQIYGTNNPYNIQNTFRHYSNGSSWITLTFSSAYASDIQSIIGEYKHAEEFLKVISYYDGIILDINHLLLLIISSIGQHKKLTTDSNIRGPLYAKAGIHNVWRRIPFLDSNTYISFIKENGLPVIQYEKTFIPASKTFDSLKPIFSEEKDFSGLIDEASQIIKPILNGIGISNIPAQEVWDAGIRSNEINQNRLNRLKSK